MSEQKKVTGRPAAHLFERVEISSFARTNLTILLNIPLWISINISALLQTLVFIGLAFFLSTSGAQNQTVLGFSADSRLSQLPTPAFGSSSKVSYVSNPDDQSTYPISNLDGVDEGNWRIDGQWVNIIWVNDKIAELKILHNESNDIERGLDRKFTLDLESEFNRKYKKLPTKTTTVRKSGYATVGTHKRWLSNDGTYLVSVSNHRDRITDAVTLEADRQATLSLVRVLNGLPGSAALEYSARTRGKADDYYVTYYFVENHRQLLKHAKRKTEEDAEQESKKNHAQLRKF